MNTSPKLRNLAQALNSAISFALAFALSFAQPAPALAASGHASDPGVKAPGESSVHVLIVVAHPDDEYCFAGTTYRLAHELGAHVDQFVITNGESGFRFSGPAEKYYGKALATPAVGRRELPDIRRHELEESGKVLGIVRHFYLHQPDGGKVEDVDQAIAGWNRKAVETKLDSVLRQEKYDIIFTFLPIPQTHGHHKAATLLALQAVERLPVESRPAIVGCWDENIRRPGKDGPPEDVRASREFKELAGKPETRINEPVSFSFDRETPFGPDGKLNYQIFVNWMIAAHKSQGLFQMLGMHDDTENFALYALNSPAAADRARALFRQVSPSAPSPTPSPSDKH